MLDVYVELPVDPTDEELARDWTLSVPDLEEVRKARGPEHRQRFAIQLCALRALGRFVDDFAAVPVRIANHIGRQLGLPPSLFIAEPERPATASEQEQRIREYLGYRAFDAKAQQQLNRWLADMVAQGVDPEMLPGLAITTLRAWKVEIPGRSTLERHISNATAGGAGRLWQRFLARLPPDFREAIDRLLDVADGERYSTLFQLKQYPPEANPAAILSYLERFELLRSMGVERVDVSDLNTKIVEQLASLGYNYGARDLRRFTPAKRYALVTCFLVEAQKTTLDHLAEMNRQFLTGMARRSRRAVELRQKEVRQRAKRGLATVVQAMGIVLDQERPAETRLADLYREFDEKTLRAAVEACRNLNELTEYGYLDELVARHAHLKRYLPRFLTLPFRAERGGADPLLSAIDISRKLETGELDQLPADAPIQFVPSSWRVALVDGRDRPDGRLWELALAFAVRDALRSGDLYLAESRHHVSFWNLVYATDQWTAKRERAYAELSMPTEFDQMVGHLRTELDAAAQSLATGLETNPFAAIRDGQLELQRRDALEVPERVREVKRVIETHLPRIRIEDLLVEVDRWCGFTRELVPLPGYRARTDRPYAALLAGLVAHGTNLGIATMAQSTDGLTVDVLHEMSKWFLRTDTLKAANRVLVDYHHRLPLSLAWGDGAASSSDGQRFGVQTSSLLASFYPRYFGYYDRAITVYTHVSDQFSAFSARAISCSPREAIFVLDGLLENDTLLRPREHYTDTHGFTEQFFGLCHLLGISFMPRLKDLKDQQLYRIDRATSHSAVDALYRGVVDVALIRDQYDALVRIASSLRNRTAPAHVVLERLAASSDRPARALTMLGRIVKTIHILRYLQDAAIRDRVQLQLNRGESRHELARRLFFANQGAFRTGDYEEIMNKVSALAVLSNAVLVWNTVRMTEILRALQTTSGAPAEATDIARISPLAHAHVIPSGTYHFARATTTADAASVA